MQVTFWQVAKSSGLMKWSHTGLLRGRLVTIRLAEVVKGGAGGTAEVGKQEGERRGGELPGGVTLWKLSAMLAVS